MTSSEVKRKLRDRLIDVQNGLVNFEATIAVGQAIVKQLADNLITIAGHEKCGKLRDGGKVEKLIGNQSEDPCLVFDVEKVTEDCQKMFDRLETTVFEKLEKILDLLRCWNVGLVNLEPLVKPPELDRLLDILPLLNTVIPQLAKDLALKQALSLDKMNLDTADQLNDDEKFGDVMATILAAWSHAPYVNESDVERLRELCLM